MGAGLKQVRDGLLWPFQVAVAMAEPEIEAWHVAGFEPRDDEERRRLKEVREALSFDPRTQSHRLTSHPNDARTDAKRLLEALCGTDQERRETCLDDRAALRRRGAMNGLSLFLREIEDCIVPLFLARR